MPTRASDFLLAAWRGTGPLTWCLFPLTLLSRAYIGLTRLAYKLGWKTTVKLPVPVIVVGNVMVGGTGKTPIVIHLAQRLTQMGWQVGVICRGDGGHHTACTEVRLQSLAQEVGDEALLLKTRLDLPVFIGKQRAQAALLLMQTYPQTQLIISDDGLQHLALHHDIALCVFDDRGLGNGCLLPAGPLRESWPRRLKEGVIQMTVHTGDRAFEDSLAAHRHLAEYAVNGRGEQRALQSWHSQAVDALAAIAQPELFFSALRKAGFLLSHTQALPDHDSLDHWQAHSANDVLCTEKDAVKLWRYHPDVWAVPLQCELPLVFWDKLMPHLVRLSLAHGHQTA